MKIDGATERIFAMETMGHNPQRRTISLQLPAYIIEAHDAITGDKIEISGKQEIVITIPVGLFRIVDCKIGKN